MIFHRILEAASSRTCVISVNTFHDVTIPHKTSTETPLTTWYWAKNNSQSGIL